MLQFSGTFWKLIKKIKGSKYCVKEWKKFHSNSVNGHVFIASKYLTVVKIIRLTQEKKMYKKQDKMFLISCLRR